MRVRRSCLSNGFLGTLWLSLILVIACGCDDAYLNKSATLGSHAKTVLSPQFVVKKGNQYRIAILPFNVSGKGEQASDTAAPDKFGMHMMEKGMRVVERMQIEGIFKELKLNLTGAVSATDMKKVGRMASVDLLVLGTITFNYIPGSSSQVGQFGGSQGGYYTLLSESIRFVDIETGEVVINSYCDSDNQVGSLSEEIANSVWRAILNRSLSTGSDSGERSN